MHIAPKLGTENTSVPQLIIPYLGDTLEVQLESFHVDDDVWKGIVYAHQLQTVILHTPFGLHNLETTLLSPPLFSAAKDYILRQLEYAERHSIDLKILYHISMPEESISRLPILEKLLELLAILDQSPRLALLLENTIVNLDVGVCRNLHDPITYILERTPADQVQVCFDLCHYLASKHVVQGEYIFPVEWLPRIFSIHFSETRNYEGYKNFPSTHGLWHESFYGVVRDLCVLRELGIDMEKAVIVSEVTEPDYQIRSREAQELAWLHEAARYGIQF